MDRTRTLPDRVATRPSQRLRPDRGPAEAHPSAALLTKAAGLAMLASLLEAGVFEAHRWFVGTVSMAAIRVNIHHLWMRPVGLLATFLVVGGLAALWLRRKPEARRVEAVATFLLCGLTFLSPLLCLDELHPLAAVALAAGLGRLLHSATRRASRRLSRIALGIGFAAAAVVAAVGIVQGFLREPLAIAALPTADASAPDVVLVVLDTVRADHLAIHGYHRDTMPTLSALAGRGVIFDNARSTAPWTLPSHASMFTGRWFHELSVDVDRPLDGRHPTIAETLAEKGYRTAGFVGNTTYCNAWYGLDRGFAHYLDAPENQEVSVREVLRSSGLGLRVVRTAQKARWFRTTGDFAGLRLGEDVNRDAIAWLNRQPTASPSFLFLNYYDAHGPYVVPDGFPREFSGADGDEFRKLVKQYRKVNNNQLRAAGTDLEAAMSRLGQHAYDDCLRYLDARLADLAAELQRRSAASNRPTWLVVTSDHGEHFGERGLHRHGNSLYRPLTHVPLVIVPIGPVSETIARRVKAPVSLRDLPATLDDLAGRDSKRFPGHSLRRFWSAETEPAADPVLAELIFHPQMANGNASGADPKGRMHHLLVEDGKSFIEPVPSGEELYDLEADPTESRDLGATDDGRKWLESYRDKLHRLIAAPR